MRALRFGHGTRSSFVRSSIGIGIGLLGLGVGLCGTVAGCSGSDLAITEDNSDAGDAAGDDSGGDGVTTEGGDAGSDAGDDGAIDGTSIDTGTTDSPLTDTIPLGDAPPPPDTTPPPDGAACAPLASGATDVYVDKRYTGGGSTGTAACPFLTIQAGITAAGALTGTRTVHVAGDAAGLIYSEVGSVLVNHNIILQGDGPLKTTISATGTCGGGMCAVVVEGGGTLDGFTVISPGGDGILTAVASPAPVVKNVSANGSKGNGIVALGSVELGPNIIANKNGGQGVAANGGGLVHVNAAGAGGSNAFDSNGANGINVEAGATLKFEGGLASGNGFNGIRLAGLSPASVVSHSIAGLTATGNKNTGVSAFNGQTVKIRRSSMVTNGNLGLFYAYSGTSTLDIGVTTDKGGNTFGGATVATRNGKAGIYLCKSRGLGTQPAESDSFSVCPPTQTSLPGCDTAPSSYTDVAYVPAIVGDPVVATTCTVGP